MQSGAPVEREKNVVRLDETLDSILAQIGRIRIHGRFVLSLGFMLSYAVDSMTHHVLVCSGKDDRQIISAAADVRYPLRHRNCYIRSEKEIHRAG